MQSPQLEFQRLFVENQRRIFGYILTLAPSSDDAQEIFQNVCIVILSKASQFVAGTDFAKWACQIAHYEVFNYRRRQKRVTWLSEEVLSSLAAKRLEAVEGGGADLEHQPGPEALETPGQGHRPEKALLPRPVGPVILG